MSEGFLKLNTFHIADLNKFKKSSIEYIFSSPKFTVL